MGRRTGIISINNNDQTLHSPSTPPIPNDQSLSTRRVLFNPVHMHMLPTGYTHVLGLGVGDAEWERVAYLKFMHRFFTYRVASSVRRCVGVVGGSGSMGNNGRRHSMAASCFQLVLCVNECLSLSLCGCVCVCLCVASGLQLLLLVLFLLLLPLCC